MSAVDVAPSLTLIEAKRMIRDALKDKSYQRYPIGEEVGHYLRSKRKRLTDASYTSYECCLDKLAREFFDLRLADLEPPVGTERIEEFLDRRYSNPGTYNTNLSIIRDFFKWLCIRGRMQGDPTLAIERARKRDVYRTTFTADQTRAIIASQDDLRDRVALRLLLNYGIRKGALRVVQFKHFDHHRKRLTIFTKGGKVRELPLPDKHLWFDLERLIVDTEARPNHYLVCLHKPIPRAGLRAFPDRPLGAHGLHNWWYRCLERAGIVPVGTTSGEKMHKARHTAGQRVLDATGNLKAVQKLLGHASIQTTGDVYADWDQEQLAATLAAVLADEDEL